MYQYFRGAGGGYWGGTGFDRMAYGRRENLLRMQEAQAPRYGKDIPVDILYGMPQDIYPEAEDPYETESRKWQERYPKRAREVQKIVEEECDRIDYPGSFLYDEYPDQIQLKRMEDTVYRIILDRHLFDEELVKAVEQAEEDAEKELTGAQLPMEPGPVRPPCRDGRCGQPPFSPPPKPGPRPPQQRPPQGGSPCGKNDWLCEMIQIILYQEMAKRRCHGRWC